MLLLLVVDELAVEIDALGALGFERPLRLLALGELVARALQGELRCAMGKRGKGALRERLAELRQLLVFLLGVEFGLARLLLRGAEGELRVRRESERGTFAASSWRWLSSSWSWSDLSSSWLLETTSLSAAFHCASFWESASSTI